MCYQWTTHLDAKSTKLCGVPVRDRHPRAIARGIDTTSHYCKVR